MDQREQNLPFWAQKLITELRERIATSNQPLIKELAKLRPQVAALTAKNDALRELLGMAALCGHATASEIMAVIDAYAPWKD